MSSAASNWFAMAASGGYAASRSACTSGGSGAAKYLYSPTPKRKRAMSTRLRKRASSAYMATISPHSSAVSTGGVLA